MYVFLHFVIMVHILILVKKEKILSSYVETGEPMLFSVEHILWSLPQIKIIINIIENALNPF